MVERWEIEGRGGCTEHSRSADGEWVRWEDHQAEVAKLRRAEEAAALLAEGAIREVDARRAEVERLMADKEAAVEAAFREGFETGYRAEYWRPTPAWADSQARRELESTDG